MCNTITENISLFWVAQFISRSRGSICELIAKEIITAQVQSLAGKNRPLNRLKVGAIRLLLIRENGMSIFAVYQKSQ